MIVLLTRIPSDFRRAGRKHKPAPSVAHGQALRWSGLANDVPAVAELECERCDDEWLQEVQNEIMNVRLTVQTQRLSFLLQSLCGQAERSEDFLQVHAVSFLKAENSFGVNRCALSLATACALTASTSSSAASVSLRRDRKSCRPMLGRTRDANLQDLC